MMIRYAHCFLGWLFRLNTVWLFAAFCKIYRVRVNLITLLDLCFIIMPFIFLFAHLRNVCGVNGSYTLKLLNIYLLIRTCGMLNF